MPYVDLIVSVGCFPHGSLLLIAVLVLFSSSVGSCPWCVFFYSDIMVFVSCEALATPHCGILRHLHCFVVVYNNVGCTCCRGLVLSGFGVQHLHYFLFE